jgi:acyl dehydratase
MRFEDLKIGMSYEMKRAFSKEEVSQFAALSYDTNPIHLDAEYAKKSMFGRLIVPGFLTGSLFSAIIGARFPGEGSIYLNQMLNFRNPVYLDQEITAVVCVKELYPEKRRVLLDTYCHDESGKTLIEGTALVKLP